MYIENQSEFEAFLERASRSKVLAIDTEFLRERTYYAKLCLLQLGTDDEVVLVDPFKIDDLTVLADILTNQNVVKLFHAAGQDLEILYRETGVLPSPLFDTQIAAALLGHAQQIGYASLVSAECGVNLKKADSFTDWSRRPLTESQLEYAADDVIYLPRIYHSMVQALEEKGRMAWLEPDFAELTDPKRYELNARERYKRLKRASHLSGRQLAAAREVAEWREIQAAKRNIPRKWVLTDEQIVEACKREARSIDELFMVRGVKEHINTRDARTVVKALVRGLSMEKEQWPDLGKPSKNEPNVDAQLDLMLALVRLRARENEVAMQTLASHDELAKVARGYTDGVSVLKGWRKKIVGAELLELLEGNISLSLDKGNLKIYRAHGKQ